jgi:4-methyl-5(b-hydroxyethyl)-thiazole monophosphate biosynthesis
MAKVLVPLATGFEEIEAVGIIDVLRRAEIEVVTASISDKREVNGANGIMILADDFISNAKSDDFDMIVLPGGIPGALHLKEDENVQRLLKEFDDKGKSVGAICAAPIALRSSGVLKSKYTCYPSYENEIGVDGYQGAQSKVVIDENVMTSRGPGTAICFALEIVKKLKGDEMYQGLKEGLLADYC